jgi:hypothetical protein
MAMTDTHKSVRAFERGGFAPTQAEVLSEQQEQTAQEIVAHMRQAFQPQFDGLRHEIAAVELRLTAKIESTARDQLHKFVVLVFSLAGVMLAAMAVMVRFLTV